MNNGIVTVLLQEGLGNIMFQIAAAIGYAKENNKQYKFYHELYKPSHHGNINIYKNNILSKLDTQSIETEASTFYYYTEPYFHYNSIPYFKENLILLGYFQSYKYFAKYKKDIVDFFDFSIDHPHKQILLNENTCSIHVRRGDYLNLPDYHPTQDISYYIKAIEMLDKNTVFFIMSDDIDWCYENFNSKNFDRKRRFIFLDNYKSFEDFYLARNCTNNIISNSTFSWWSAWLNKNPSKKIICPNKNKWFGSNYKDKDAKDIACPEWITL